jgi:hypothetical protein
MLAPLIRFGVQPPVKAPGCRGLIYTGLTFTTIKILTVLGEEA